MARSRRGSSDVPALWESVRAAEVLSPIETKALGGERAGTRLTGTVVQPARKGTTAEANRFLPTSLP